ncbi:MAG: hypothetical protein GY749_31300 [Desulfobacteraceae bacterium]|nr:hypothetical protein [Desulfobacteraceae bacterium]
MLSKKSMITLYAIMFLLLAGAANAQFTGSASGIWIDPVPDGDSPAFTGVETSHFEWGLPETDVPPNSLTFQGTSFNVLSEVPFKLGSVTYYNGATTLGTSATAVTLKITLDISLPETVHFETTHLVSLISTPNEGTEWEQADYVFFPDSLSEQYFDLDGKKYKLELIGFSQDEGENKVKEFHVLEDDGTSAELYGWLTAVNPEATLTHIEISGPGNVHFETGRNYTCTAYYDDNSTRDVTPVALWSDGECEYGDIDSSGLFEAVQAPEAGPSSYNCSITASYRDQTDTHSININNASFMTITPLFHEVSKTEGTVFINISNTTASVMEWTAVSDADWISISPNSGTDNAKIAVNYESNSGDARVATITITAPNAENSPQTVEIRQSPGYSLSVSPVSLEVPATEGTSVFEIENTASGMMEWTVAGNADWLSTDPNSGVNNASITVNYETNPGPARTAIITVSAPDAVNSPKDVEITQATGLILSVAPGSRAVGSVSGQTDFSIENTGPGIMEWTVSHDSDWFSVEPGSGTNNSSVTVKYDTNSGDSRTGTITITAPGADDSPQTFEIRQEPVDWTNMPSEDSFGNSFDLRDIWGSSENNVFAVGEEGTVLRYDGNEDNMWTKMASNTSSYLRGIWGSSENNIFAVGHSGTIIHYGGNAWSEMTGITSNDLWDVWGSSENDVYAVGEKGTIIHYNGTWTTMTSPVIDNLHSVWGSAGNDIYAVGGGWNSLKILHYDGNAWEKMPVNSTDAMYAVWGSSGNNIFAVGNSGSVFRYGGTWHEKESISSKYLRGVWGTTGKNVFAVGVEGTIVHYSGSAWEATSSGTSKHLYGVWGDSESNVFVVGDSGVILRYSSYANIPGDVDGNGVVELPDAILALKVMAGIENAGIINRDADVSLDSKIGMEEVSYILRTVLSIDK